MAESVSTPIEVWRPVVGARGYEVSDHGRVRSLPNKTRSGTRILNPGIVYGYKQVCLYASEGKVNQRKVHRLVLEAFVGPMPEGCTLVRHLDGNKQNNTVGNLAWGTAQENSNDSVKLGTAPAGESHGRAKLTEHRVLEIRRRYQGGEKLKPLAAEFGVGTSTAWSAITGESWKCLERSQPLSHSA